MLWVYWMNQRHFTSNVPVQRNIFTLGHGNYYGRILIAGPERGHQRWGIGHDSGRGGRGIFL